MFLNSCPWNRHTLAWRGVYCRLRISRTLKWIRVFKRSHMQHLLHMFMQTVAIVLISVFCMILVLISPIWMKIFFCQNCWKTGRCQECRSYVSILSIVDHRVYIPACLLAASSSPCQACQHPCTSVCFFRSSHSALECPVPMTATPVVVLW